MYSSMLSRPATSLRDSKSVPLDFIFSPGDCRVERPAVLLPAPYLCGTFARLPLLSRWSSRFLHVPLHPLVSLQQSYRSPRETEEFVPPAFHPCELSLDPDPENVD